MAAAAACCSTSRVMARRARSTHDQRLLYGFAKMMAVLAPWAHSLLDIIFLLDLTVCLTTSFRSIGSSNLWCDSGRAKYYSKFSVIVV